MNYLQRAAGYVLRRRPSLKKLPSVEVPPPAKEHEMTKVDAYLNYACKLLSWEDAPLTWSSFICVNFLFLLLIYYETRFYCVVFTSAALLVVLDYYDDAIDVRNLKRYLCVRDISTWCSTFMYHMHCWKRDNPSLFCGVMTTFFLTLSFIGRTVSGRLLVYLLILCIYFGPALLKIAPKEVQDSFWQFVVTVQNNEIVNENELIPVITENSDDDNNDETRTQDSFTSSLISGICVMPSHMDENEVPDLQEDDLLPAERTKRHRRDFTDSSSDSDMDLDQADSMHFDTQHFIGDVSTSSSDEERYAKDLHFSDVQDSSLLGAYTQSLAGGVIGSLLSNLQANFSSQAGTQQPDRVASTRRDSSDQSDFEMINTDDADAET